MNEETLDGVGTVAPKGNGLAIAGMVVGIVAAILSIFTIGVSFGIIAIALAGVGLYQIMQTSGSKGMAVAGIVLGAFAIAFSYFQLSRVESFVKDGGGKTFMDELQKKMDEKMDEAKQDAFDDLED